MAKKKKEKFTPQSDNYAVYLPAIQSGYSNFAAQNKLSEKSNGRMPPKLKPTDLNWFNPKNKLFDYDYGLYSAGQFNKVLTKKPDMVFQRQKGKIIVGDSGGYQVGTGVLTDTKRLDFEKPQAVYDAWMGDLGERVLEWIVQWLDTHVDYAMVLEIPLWAAAPGNENSPFRKLSYQQIMDCTERNLRFTAERRGVLPGARAKFLNIMHDVDTLQLGKPTVGEDWYERLIRPFQFEGVAFGGMSAQTALSMLYWLRRMADDGYLANYEWIHYLGLSEVRWTPVLTAIQRTLRKQLKNGITVSCDSSSPFQTGGIYSELYKMPKYSNDEKSWTISTEKIEQDLKYAQQNTLYPFPHAYSPLAKYVTLNDFHQKSGVTKERFASTVSYNLAINHNVYTQLKAIEEANRLVFDEPNNGELVPAYLLDLVDVAEKIFTVENWQTVMADNEELLRKLAR